MLWDYFVADATQKEKGFISAKGENGRHSCPVSIAAVHNSINHKDDLARQRSRQSGTAAGKKYIEDSSLVSRTANFCFWNNNTW